MAAVGSQHCQRLQLPIGETQFWGQQRRPFFDLVEGVPRHASACPAAAAQHSAPVTLHDPVDLYEALSHWPAIKRIWATYRSFNRVDRHRFVARILRRRPRASLESSTDPDGGWHTNACFGFIKDRVEKKVSRHMAHSRQRQGFGWERWSRQWLYNTLRLFSGYRVQRDRPTVAPG
jgi:hypothetical protein